MSGGDTQVYVLTEPIIGPGLALRFSYRGELWHLGGGPSSELGNSPVSWYASLGPEAGLYSSLPYRVELQPID